MQITMILNSEPFPWLSVVLWLGVGAAIVALVWRQLSNTWIRTFARALVIAVIFTPISYSPPARLAPHLSMPAWYALYVGFTEERLLGIVTVLWVGFVTWILWTIGLAVYWLKKTRRL
jgi:hypothetical protein